MCIFIQSVGLYRYSILHCTVLLPVCIIYHALVFGFQNVYGCNFIVIGCLCTRGIIAKHITEVWYIDSPPHPRGRHTLYFFGILFSWLWIYCTWVYVTLSSNSQSPLVLLMSISARIRHTRCYFGVLRQLKTERHDIFEILLKVA